jgi:small subunit ribosomal protein S4
MNSILKNFTTQAKNLVTVKNPQVERERKQLLTKLFSLGLLGKDAKIEDVLSLTLKDVMERRLQTLVYRKNLASSLKQAKQFIVHGHIALGDRTITAPSYLVLSEQENSIGFAKDSVLSNASHPERTAVKKEKKRKKVEKKETKTAVKEEETDKKVKKMVEKTKKFAEGKEETAADILKEVKKEEEQKEEVQQQKKKKGKKQKESRKKQEKKLEAEK